MNEKLIDVLNDMATYEDYLGRTFPAKAYRKAVKEIQGLDFEVSDVSQVVGIPGIGSGISKKIEAFLKDGTFPRYEEYKASPAAKIEEIASIKGIRTAKAKELFNAGVTSLDQLKKLTEGLAVGAKIPGTAVTFTNALSIGLQYEAHTDKNRMPIDVHDSLVKPLIEELKGIPGVSRVAATGSARRYDGSAGYTVGDADLVVGIASEDAVAKIQESMYKMLDEVIMCGDTKISGIKNRKQVDVRIVKDEDYESMLLHSTGPMAFNIICRKAAIKNGWKLNEYGLFDANGSVLAKGEKEILEKLGIGWVDPTKRKDYSAGKI